VRRRITAGRWLLGLISFFRCSPFARLKKRLNFSFG
jgi:hypothetical protein